MCWPLPQSLLAMTLAFRRSGLGLEHCGFMYIGKLQQWHYAALRIIGVDLAGLLGGGTHGRPLSRRIPPPAGSVPRRRRRKKFGAPPGQPKFMDAAAAVFFSARCGASEKSTFNRVGVNL